ncbi:MAG: polyprenyl synthetase family protein [Lachnospiraceae bacterium]|nr:polyprenyl synthetase family protein [Lachnospiraceae bacterium]
MKQQMNRKICDIEDVLKKYLPEKKGYQKTIFEAMEYALMSGGKRIRPMFMHEIYTMLGGNEPAAIEPFMAAIEMIHTYSLIHDDLPAMDNDEYRRGRKTTHIVYGEAMGILAGDALLNYAYETAAKAFDSKRPDRAMAAYRVLVSKAGVFGMVGGQVVDVEMNGKIPDMDMLTFIYKLKTAALLEASFMIGGIMAGMQEREVDMLCRIARNIGIAFQIRDDILDVTSTTEELGKPVKSDERNDKTTYIALCGMDAAEKAVMEYSESALNLLDKLPAADSKEYVVWLVTELIHRKK